MDKEAINNPKKFTRKEILMQLIGLGDNLTISTKSGYSSKLSYPSRVSEVLGEHLFLVDAPIFQQQIVRLPINKECIFVFYTKSGLYQASGTILEYLTDARVTLLKIEVISFEHIQRRDFYRVNASIPFTFSLLQKPEPPEQSEQPEEQEQQEPAEAPDFKGIIKNISGSGLRFTTSEPLYPAEHIICNLNLESKVLNAEGVILSVEPYGKVPDITICRLCFVNIDKRQQEEIVRYVMKIERGIMIKNEMKSREKPREKGKG